MTDSTLTPPAADMMSFCPPRRSIRTVNMKRRYTPASARNSMSSLKTVRTANSGWLKSARRLTRCSPLPGLYCALAAMPAKLDAALVEPYRNLLVREMHLYQTLCDQANLRREHVLAVRYCLCTALDEAANNTTWDGAASGPEKACW